MEFLKKNFIIIMLIIGAIVFAIPAFIDSEDCSDNTTVDNITSAN